MLQNPVGDMGQLNVPQQMRFNKNGNRSAGKEGACRSGELTVDLPERQSEEQAGNGGSPPSPACLRWSQIKRLTTQTMIETLTAADAAMQSAA